MSAAAFFQDMVRYLTVYRSDTRNADMRKKLRTVRIGFVAVHIELLRSILEFIARMTFLFGRREVALRRRFLDLLLVTGHDRGIGRKQLAAAR